MLGEVFSSLAPMRVTSSESVPCVDMSILYNGRLRRYTHVYNFLEGLNEIICFSRGIGI